MRTRKSNNIGHRSVDLDFWKKIKIAAAKKGVSMLEYQRMIAADVKKESKEDSFDFRF